MLCIFCPSRGIDRSKRNTDDWHCQTHVCAVALRCGIACLDLVGSCTSRLVEGLGAEEPVSEIPFYSSASASDAVDVELFNSSEPELESRCSLQDPDVPVEEVTAPKCSLMTLLICWEWSSYESLHSFKVKINRTVSDRLLAKLKPCKALLNYWVNFHTESKRPGISPVTESRAEKKFLHPQFCPYVHIWSLK